MSSKLVPVEGENRWLDRFELVAELATGGMATVYLGRLSGAGGFQRFVGIKRLHPHLAREPEFIEMFLEEARLAARIHHPNVVPILEIGTSEQGYYIVMEYVEGDTLANLIARAVQRGQRVPVHVAVRVLVDVLAGLHAAHELADDDGKPLGIVHRDVSPQNILIGIDGSARLTDFGVARATSKLSTTRTGQLKGKLAYMAPEQARGAKDIDRRADIFAAGVVMWEALEGRRLFKGDGEADTLNKVLYEPIPSLEDAVRTVPHEIETALEGALDRERLRRFSTAAAFAEALERAAQETAEMATHKDVAAYLEEMLGEDILNQRETVRAWIARGDPNRPKSLSMPPPAPTPSTLPRLGQRPLSPESTPSSGASVASAVISNHGLPVAASLPRAEATRPSGRSRVLPWAIAAVALAGAGVGLTRWQGAHDESGGPRRSAETGSALSAPPAPPVAQVPSPGSALVEVPAPLAASDAATVAPPAVSSAAPPHDHGRGEPTLPSSSPPGNGRGEPTLPSSSPAGNGRGEPPLPSGSPTIRQAPTAPPASRPPSNAPVPDDISRNPYR
ncbi:MAG TPA: protein kinase [Polyangiaceae bacterium]|nr:protein kinase [Polyangiaceae bacterium]